jgi:hypothetical protein
MTFFTELENNIKIHMEAQKARISQGNLEQKRKKNNSKGIIKLNLILYYRTIITETSWY